jgi:hypothetical protein
MVAFGRAAAQGRPLVGKQPAARALDAAVSAEVFAGVEQAPDDAGGDGATARAATDPRVS